MGDKCQKCKGHLYSGWHTNVPGKKIGREADDTICIMMGALQRELATKNVHLRGQLTKAKNKSEDRRLKLVEMARLYALRLDEMDKLKRILQPFAAYAKCFSHHPRENDPPGPPDPPRNAEDVVLWNRRHQIGISVGSFRKARNAAHQMDKPKEEPGAST